MKLPSSLTYNLNRTSLVLKKNSPNIMVATGVIGVIAGAILLCKETLKVNDILEESREEIDTIKKEFPDDKKELTKAYISTAKKVTVAYAPGIIIGTASLGLILAANNEQNRRIAAVGAAYSAIDTAFSSYRKAVIEELGEEKDLQFRHGLVKKKIEEVEIDPETGKEKKVKKDALVSTIDGYSDYSRFFDSSCPDWEESPEQNFIFLRMQQNYANDKLKIQGHLFLNEVYDMLGLPRTEAGSVVGWIYDSENPIGDNYVDFGLYDCKKEKTRDFVNGYENVILLDFNVDGLIYDKI